MAEWINCKDAMPPEEDSPYARLWGTGLWQKNKMYMKSSKLVNITVRNLDDTYKVDTARTIDGKWSNSTYEKGVVVAWMPLPEPYKEGRE